jgi:hypothetical protein
MKTPAISNDCWGFVLVLEATINDLAWTKSSEQSEAFVGSRRRYFMTLDARDLLDRLVVRVARINER